ncbi:hypothetical protein [Pedobacter aquatilis]|uniref:hypothetical protein n=1 Tax=Pedobacter aquatilis TaxID=351343 RepID=UPI00293153DB|nr:hypothetical protein [Pedobacter aquatilis]
MINISKNTHAVVLDNVKKGDFVRCESGKMGEVVAVQVLAHNTQKEYFYKIKDEGVILIIK